MILHCCEEILKPLCCSVQKTLQKRLLVRLKAAGDAVLVHAAAAVAQAALTDVLPGARRIHITATVHQQILPLTHITEFVCEERLPLYGVSALRDLPAAVAQVKLHSPGNVVVGFPRLQERPVVYGSLLLFEGACEKVKEGQAEDDPQHPASAQQPADHHGGFLLDVHQVQVLQDELELPVQPS